VSVDAGVPDPPLPFTGGRIPATDEERACVERRILRQFILAPAAAAALLLVGFSIGRPRVAAAGLLGFGLLGVWIGAQAISEGRLMFIRGGSMTLREYRYFIYEGLAAIPYGLAYVLGGLCLGAVATLVLGGATLARIRAVVLARPGYALVPFGATLFCYGLGFFVGFVRREGSVWNRAFSFLLDAPARLGGLILVVWAAATLWIGLVEWTNPPLFHRWFEVLTGNPWPFTG
jgi:hypothetical protein